MPKKMQPAILLLTQDDLLEPTTLAMLHDHPAVYCVRTAEEARQHLTRLGSDVVLIASHIFDHQLCDHFYESLLKKNLVPGAILVASGLPGFEDAYRSIRESYTQYSVPFFFLTLPFDKKTLLERIDHAVLLMQRSAASSRTPQRPPSLALHHPGSILSQICATLGWSVRDFAAFLDSERFAISQTQLESLQEACPPTTLSALEWYHLCRALRLSTACLVLGYDAHVHLTALQQALSEKTLSPIAADLLRATLERTPPQSKTNWS